MAYITGVMVSAIKWKSLYPLQINNRKQKTTVSKAQQEIALKTTLSPMIVPAYSKLERKVGK